MRILIFTPTWMDSVTGEDGIHPACAALIERQRGVEADWHISADNPFPVYNEKHERVYHYENVLHQYRQAREYFLAGAWDALLTVEHDNVLPDDGAVARLGETMAQTSAAVVYAPYLLRHSRPYLLSTFQWINHRNLGMSLSNYPRELRRARQANVWKVSGAGMGCTLFSRGVLEAIEFQASSKRNACPDLGFAEEALRRGFVSLARFDVPVAHYHGGAWLVPFQEGIVNKYLAIESVRAVAAGRYVTLKAGEWIELSEEEANDLARVGYIQISDQQSAVSDQQSAVSNQPAEVEPPQPQAEQPVVAPKRRSRKAA